MVATSKPIRIAIGSLGLLILVPALISLVSALLGNHPQEITVPAATLGLLITGGYFYFCMDRERGRYQCGAPQWRQNLHHPDPRG